MTISLENRLAICRYEMQKLAAAESLDDLLLVFRSTGKKLHLAMVINNLALQGALGMTMEAVLDELASRAPEAFASWRDSGFGNPWPFFLPEAGHA